MPVDPKLTRSAIQLFEKRAAPTTFFQSMFNDNDPTNSSKIPVDIVREEEDVAVDVVVGSGAANFRKHEPLTNKEYTPPEYDEAYEMSADEVVERIAGANAYTPVDRMAQAANHISKSLRKSRNRIIRSMELQAVEIFTNGTITLKNNESLDYKMKGSHKITVATGWADPAADALGDIEGAGDVIRQDALMEPDLLIFGQDAIRFFLANNAVKDQLNFRRADLANIQAPRGAAESGGKFHGLVSVGPYTYQVWSYPQFYRDSETLNKVRYMPVDKVVVRASAGQMDAYWGAINRFADGNHEGAQIAGNGSAIASSQAVRFAPYVFLGNRGKVLEVGIRSRPLLVPTDIDSFACLDVTP